MTATASPDLSPAVAVWRSWLLRGIALLYALVLAGVMFGLPSAITAWFTSGVEAPLRTHFVVWGALAGVLLPAAAFSIAFRPYRSLAAAQQLAVFALAAVLGLSLAFEAENATYVAMLVLPALLLLLIHPLRGSLFRGGRPDLPLLTVALVGLIASVPYAVANLRASAHTSYLDDLHGGYVQAGILAIFLVLSTAVAAWGSAGWRVTAWSVVVAALMLGVAGVLYPSDPSSVGRAAGFGLLAAAAVVAIRTLTRSRTPG